MSCFSSYFCMTTRSLDEKFKSTQCLSPLLFVCLFVLNMENLDCFQNLKVLHTTATGLSFLRTIEPCISCAWLLDD